MNVCVVGLGYVGLPLAELCVKKGYSVKGFDTDKKKIDMISNGVSPVEDVKSVEGIEASVNPEIISDADIIAICVPTPVDKKYHPDLKPLISACENAKNYMKKEALIIIESTINPGVSEEVVKPIFGGNDGEDYFLAHCPERINPGDKVWNVENLPRVLGSTTEKGLEKAYEFYSNILTGEVRRLSSIKVAEAVKIVENSFRDINIAFVNELAKSFDLMGIDAVEVINGAATKPFGFMAHYPSCGVGGHCIPVDPYYLIEQAKMNGFNHSFLRLAREINKSMPGYTVEIIADELNKISMPVKGTKIGILGVSYKGNIADVRESPAFDIIKLLKAKGGEVKVHDPYVKEYSDSELNEVLECDCVVVCSNHDSFKELDYSKCKVVIDGKNYLDRNKIKNYKGVGR
ncbi:MAG: nucleotide sugar dehydrogenase [Nanobdellota archaeon]